MDYPEAVLPVSREPLTLPLGITVLIPHSSPVFPPWKGSFARKKVQINKPVLTAQGRPCFAEQMVLKIFEAGGWHGLWVGTLGRAFQTSAGEPGKLPAPQAALMNDIYTRTVTRTGCFDIIAWRGEENLFIEVRWKGKEVLGSGRLRWLSAALKAGLPADAFLIVEWKLAVPPGKFPA